MTTQQELTNALQLLKELQQRNAASEAQLAQSIRTGKFALAGLAAVICTVGICSAVIFSKYPMERYIHTDNAKQFCEAQTQSQPLITLNTVTEFAKDCALDIDTFGHDNAIENINKMAARCMTPGFREEFFKADWLASRVETVQNKLLRVNSQTTGPVIVQSSGTTPNGYMWRVQVPIKRYFRQGESLQGSNERVYIMDVYRVTTDAFNPVGLAIHAVNEVNPTR